MKAVLALSEVLLDSENGLDPKVYTNVYQITLTTEMYPENFIEFIKNYAHVEKVERVSNELGFQDREK